MSLFASTIILNAILFAFDFYVLIRVCMTKRLMFPITIVASLLVYSLASIVAFIASNFLIRLYQGNDITCDEGEGLPVCNNKILGYL